MAKQTMGKDDNGVFHPGKGKPSGANKVEGLGIQPTVPEKMEEYLELTEKYTVDEDELDPSLHVRHPNRKTSKVKDTVKPNNSENESDKTLNERFTEDRSAAVPEELPGILDKDTFKELANFTSSRTVTIFLATHAAGLEVNENVDLINFKNRLQEVEQKLSEAGSNEAEIKTLLQPGYDLLRTDEFWKQLSPGLAVFIAEGYFKYIKMPIAPLEECIVIQPAFYVGPLVPIMTCKEYFFLLVISKKTVKLFKADYFGMEKIDVELPQGIDQVKRLSGLDATTFRSGSSGSRAPVASQEGSYHGTGGGNPDGKDNLLVYFEAVDDILWEQVLNKENAPLLLAGVEYEIPIYKSACDYHNVWPVALTGSREHQEHTALYQDAKELMKPYFEERRTKALNLYMNNIATGKTSSMPDRVIPASYYSQISHLFVAKGEHLWGSFDEMANELRVYAGPAEGAEDLIGKAVVKTLANGGEVFFLEKENMPGNAEIAALLRF